MSRKKILLITLILIICINYCQCVKPKEIGDAEVKIILGITQLERKYYENAMEEFRIASQILPDYPPIYYLWGGALFLHGKIEEAEKKLEKGVGLYDNYTYARIFLGHIYVEEALYSRAWIHYKRVLEITNGVLDDNALVSHFKPYMDYDFIKYKIQLDEHALGYLSYIDISRIMEFKAKYDSAIKCAGEALKYAKTNEEKAMAYYYRARSMVFVNKEIEAYQELQNSLFLFNSPKSEEVYQVVKEISEKSVDVRAFLYYLRGIDIVAKSPFKSISYFENALKISPNFSIVKRNLAEVLIKEGKLERAKGLLMDNIEQDSLDIKSRLLTARIHEKELLFEKSLKLIDSALINANIKDKKLLEKYRDEINAKLAIYNLCLFYEKNKRAKDLYEKQSDFLKKRINIRKFEDDYSLKRRNQLLIGLRVQDVDVSSNFGQATILLKTEKSNQLEKTEKKLLFVNENGKWSFVSSEYPNIEELYRAQYMGHVVNLGSTSQ